MRNSNQFVRRFKKKEEGLAPFLSGEYYEIQIIVAYRFLLFILSVIGVLSATHQRGGFGMISFMLVMFFYRRYDLA